MAVRTCSKCAEQIVFKRGRVTLETARRAHERTCKPTPATGMKISAAVVATGLVGEPDEAGRILNAIEFEREACALLVEPRHGSYGWALAKLIRARSQS